MGLNHLQDIRREYHHVKVLTDGHEDYEPAMFLIRDTNLGRSFIIPQSCMWKYLDPKDNADVANWDRQEFDKLAARTHFQMQITFGKSKRRVAEDAAAIVFAEQLNINSGVLLCTGFSLFKACQILDLSVSTQTLCQLMMFIQDGLEELKNMKPAEAENRVETGEAVLRINGKTYYAPVETTETDLARGDA